MMESWSRLQDSCVEWSSTMSSQPAKLEPSNSHCILSPRKLWKKRYQLQIQSPFQNMNMNLTRASLPSIPKKSLKERSRRQLVLLDDGYKSDTSGHQLDSNRCKGNSDGFKFNSNRCIDYSDGYKSDWNRCKDSSDGYKLDSNQWSYYSDGYKLDSNRCIDNSDGYKLESNRCKFSSDGYKLDSNRWKFSSYGYKLDSDGNSDEKSVCSNDCSFGDSDFSDEYIKPKKVDSTTNSLPDGDLTVAARGSGIKPYPCPIQECQIKSESLKEMNNHRNQHFENMFYVCLVCGRSFQSRYTRDAHAQLHSL